MTKHPSRKVMNFRHLLGCDTIRIMYHHFLGGITTETIFDLISLSPHDECFQIIILFLVFSILIQFTQKQKRNPVARSQQNCRTLSGLASNINIVHACISAYASCVFSLRYQVLVLTFVQFWELKYKMLARPINLSL